MENRSTSSSISSTTTSNRGTRNSGSGSTRWDSSSGDDHRVDFVVFFTSQEVLSVFGGSKRSGIEA